MDCRDCPWVILPYELCFAEYTFIPYKYFLANFVIIINLAFRFYGQCYDQLAFAYVLQLLSSQL
jgi:hypothetical protein